MVIFLGELPDLLKEEPVYLTDEASLLIKNLVVVGVALPYSPPELLGEIVVHHEVLESSLDLFPGRRITKLKHTFHHPFHILRVFLHHRFPISMYS